MAAPDGRATLADLMRLEGKAELIGGKVVRYQPSGARPAGVAGEIAFDLSRYVDRTGVGEVYTSTLVYAVPELRSGRETFSPDVSYYNGPLPTNDWGPIEEPPTFAVEVRKYEDYQRPVEAERAAKRADYFEAGTLVVWDIDPVEDTIACYRPDGSCVMFRLGDVADAEPAVPGWRMRVDEILA